MVSDVKVDAEEVRKNLAKFEKAVRRLARLGWVVPMSSTPAEVMDLLRILEDDPIDTHLTRLYSREDSYEFRRLVDDLRETPILSRFKALLAQCLEAYLQAHYLIVVPSLLTVIDGLLADADPSSRASTNPIPVSKLKVRDALPESVTRIIWISINEFLEQVFGNVDFRGPRPFLINRNWILHGRDVPDWTQADCLRLLLAIQAITARLRNAPPKREERTGTRRASASERHSAGRSEDKGGGR